MDVVDREKERERERERDRERLSEYLNILYIFPCFLSFFSPHDACISRNLARLNIMPGNIQRVKCSKQIKSPWIFVHSRRESRC